MIKYITPLIGAFALYSCGASNTGSNVDLPKPVNTNHIETHGAGFTMNGKVRYGCSYNFKNLSHGTYSARVYFENPSDKSRPYVVTKNFTFPTGPVMFQSQEIPEITSKTNYQVKLILRRGGNSGPVIDTHTQYVNFPITPSMAKMFGITTKIH